MNSASSSTEESPIALTNELARRQQLELGRVLNKRIFEFMGFENVDTNTLPMTIEEAGMEISLELSPLGVSGVEHEVIAVVSRGDACVTIRRDGAMITEVGNDYINVLSLDPKLYSDAVNAIYAAISAIEKKRSDAIIAKRAEVRASLKDLLKGDSVGDNCNWKGEM